MSARRIEVTAKPGYSPDIARLAKEHAVIDCVALPEYEERQTHLITVESACSQKLLDDLHGLLNSSATARILLMEAESILPLPSKSSPTTTREELFNDVAHGAELSGNFLLLVLLSTVVAAIGLLKDNVAVVIGAMVIAPLLGPNLAFALASALGDTPLMTQAARTNLAGVALTLILGIVLGLFHPQGLDSPELLARTEVGPDGIALALASGAAAVLSLTTGLSSTLVGVMVAVALLPPAITIGIMLGAGLPEMAKGAAFLLIVNVVCVNLSALVVFAVKGIQPRDWPQMRNAKRALPLHLAIWGTLLVILFITMLLE